MTMYQTDLREDDVNHKLIRDFLSQYFTETDSAGKNKSSCIEITAVKQIKNKFLSLNFLIKKRELELKMKKENQLLPDSHDKMKLYVHCTATENVDSIIKENLDWRRSRNGVYGLGACFAKLPDYARKFIKVYEYNDTSTSSCQEKCVPGAFLFFEILEGHLKTVEFNTKDIIPKEGADTYHDANDETFVKFDDFTYHPMFVVFYNDIQFMDRHTLPRFSNGIAAKQKDFLEINVEKDYQIHLRQFLKEILKISYENKDEFSEPEWPVKSDVKSKEAEILSGDSVSYGATESKEQPESDQMDILCEMLSAIPNTWTQFSKISYEQKGYLITIASPEEYQRVVETFELFVAKMKYMSVMRVQNPFQLTRYKISREQAKAEGRPKYEMLGYNVVSSCDLETALLNTLDYRRYQQLVQENYKQPKFFSHVEDAVNAFLHYQNLDPYSHPLILMCNILSSSADDILTRTQADYNINYIISFQLGIDEFKE